ncbi:hypothetical protein QF041_005626 [Paenibacillus sp. W2I17]|nr:hypothetical protein [Paenibacillus sp. W2I17]
MIREAEARDAAVIERLYKELLPNNLNTKVLAERIEEVRNNPTVSCLCMKCVIR